VENRFLKWMCTVCTADPTGFRSQTNHTAVAAKIQTDLETAVVCHYSHYMRSKDFRPAAKKTDGLLTTTRLGFITFFEL
jgi:hypothetical protein